MGESVWLSIDCCVAEGVIPYCYKLCTYNALVNAENADLLLCSFSLRRIAACGTSTYKSFTQTMYIWTLSQQDCPQTRPLNLKVV